MVAIKARFDGERVILPPDMRGVPPGEVIQIFEEPGGDEPGAWLRAQEPGVRGGLGQ